MKSKEDKDAWGGHSMQCVLLLITTTGAIWMSPDVALGRTETVGSTLASAPGTGGNFVTVGVPVLSGAGQVTFQATTNLLSSLPGSPVSVSGVWSGAPGSISLVASTGQSVPSSPFGAAYKSFSSQPAINDAGQVALLADFHNGSGQVDSTRDQGIVSGLPGAMSIVAHKGVQAPGGSTDSLFTELDAPMINTGGDVVLTGRSSERGSGIWSGPSGDLKLVVDRSTVPADSSYISSLSEPSLNQTGQVAFGAFVNFRNIRTPQLQQSSSATTISRSHGLVNRIWLVDSPGDPIGTANNVVRRFDLAPGTLGAHFDRIYSPRLNNDGLVAFTASLIPYDPYAGDTIDTGPDANDSGIWRGGTDSLFLIVREGSHAPGTPVETRFDSFSDDPSFNDRENVAFTGKLRNGFGGVDSSNDAGVWAGSIENITLLARKGDQAPGAPPGAVFDDFVDDFTTINNTFGGQVVFLADLKHGVGGVDESNDRGLWITDQNGEMLLIAREGENGIETLDVARDSRGDDGRRILNDFGQVAYWTQSAGSPFPPSLPLQAAKLFTPELHWRNSGFGSNRLDNHNKWTLSIRPGEVHDVFIDPELAVSIAGLQQDMTVKSLTIGGSGFLTVDVTLEDDFLTSTLTVLEELTVTSLGRLRQFGSVNVVAGSVTNDGELIQPEGSGDITVTGSVVNNNDMSLLGSLNEITGILENNGELRIGSLVNTGGITNRGELDIDRGRIHGGTVINEATGTINTRAPDRFQTVFEADVTNFGLFQVTGDLLRLNGSFANHGHIGIDLSELDSVLAIAESIDNSMGGTITVEGGTLYVDDTLWIGNTGGGGLTIENGGTVTSNRQWIGKNTGANGSVIVLGSGSTWNNSQSLIVGEEGSGDLIILDGGIVSTDTYSIIAERSGGNGAVTVTGNGSRWDNTLNLSVGHGGTGSLEIESGARVTNTWSKIGSETGSQGFVVVEGVGSSWNTSDFMHIGSFGDGELTIRNGGAVTGTWARIGTEMDSVGSVSVSGIGSTWTNSGDLLIGRSGHGTLTITNGGVVSNTAGVIGANSGSTGSVTAEGVGSTWTNSTNLTVGGQGAGTLEVNDSAMVTVTGTATVGSQGVLTVDDGIFTASTLTIELGGIVSGVSINNTNLIPDDRQFASTSNNGGRLDISGATTISSGGTLTLDGGSLTTASLDIAPGGVFNFISGNLVVDSINQPSGDAFTFADGVLSMDTLTGDLIQNGGVLTPGNSPGVTTIDGDYTINTGSIQIEVGGRGGTGVVPDGHDQVSVANTAALNGTLTLDLINGFTPVVGDVFTIVTADEITGGFNEYAGDVFTLDSHLALVPVIDTVADDVTLVTTYPGDANIDFKVDAADLNLLALNWQDNAEDWFDADFNHDGLINAADLNLLALNWQSGVTSTPGASLVSLDKAFAKALAAVNIPEPSSLAMLILGSLATVRRRPC